MEDNTQYLKELAEAEKRRKQTEIEQAKAEALRSYQTQEAEARPMYQQQRQTANTQSQLGAKNLAEFWANRGQTNAGITAQAEMSRQNTLAGNLGDITTNEGNYIKQLQDQTNTTTRNLDYQLQDANSGIDNELTTNLYNEKLRQQQAEVQRQQALAEEQRYQQEQLVSQQQYADKMAQQEFENSLDIANYNLSVSKEKNSNNDKNLINNPLAKVGNYNNITVPYQPGLIKAAIPNGNTTVYNLANGSTITLPAGVNPFTGDINKDAYKTVYNKTTGKEEKVLKVFANGYQPITYTVPTNKWTTASGVAGKNYGLSATGAKVKINGNTQNIDKVGNTNEFVVWDDTKNKYLPLTATEKKQAGLVK